MNFEFEFEFEWLASNFKGARRCVRLLVHTLHIEKLRENSTAIDGLFIAIARGDSSICSSSTSHGRCELPSLSVPQIEPSLRIASSLLVSSAEEALFDPSHGDYLLQPLAAGDDGASSPDRARVFRSKSDFTSLCSSPRFLF